MDIIDKSIELNKRIYVDNQKDFDNLMKLAERKGFLWYSSTKPTKFFYPYAESIHFAIRFKVYPDGDKRIGASSNVKKYSCIRYKENVKEGNILW